MSHPIEDRLREAYQAKTAQLTEQRLDQLAVRRERSLDDLLDGGQPTGELPMLGFEEVPTATRHRWAAPALAAAAVVALAVGAAALVAKHLDPDPPTNSPALQVVHPTPSSSPTASAPGPATSTAIAGPGYLPRGRTGSRDDVPWSVVGSGWRLLLPLPGGTALYLYDPAGGRYLISDRLPAGAVLLAWSPDGTRAMLRTGDSDLFRYREVRLRTGELSTGFSVPLSSFVSYTQPKGLAVLVTQTEGSTRLLVRYGTDGQMEHRYADDVAGLGRFNPDNAVYLADGGQFLGAGYAGPLALLSNDGQLVRTYPLPDGFSSCEPVRWWTGTSVLERCQRQAQPSQLTELYLQPVAGGRPTALTTGGGLYGLGYWNAWPISNGHALLENLTGCGNGGYDILLGDGSTRPLRGPAGIAAGTPIVNIAADLVTFERQTVNGCGPGQRHYSLVDYNLVTGATYNLLDSTAAIVSWPADGN